MACNMRETKIKLFYDKSKTFALSLIRFDILRGKKVFLISLASGTFDVER